MIDQLDRDIRDLVTRAATCAPDPVNWHDVATRATADDRAQAGRDSRPHRWMLIASVAAAVGLLLGGLVISSRLAGVEPVVPNTAVNDVSVPSENGLRPLETLLSGDAIISTALPEGWSVTPQFVHARGGLVEFDVTDADGSVLSVRVMFADDIWTAIDSTGVNRIVTLAGLEWTVQEQQFVTNVGDARITIHSLRDVDPAIVEAFVDGLMAGNPSQTTSGFFNVESDGVEVAESATGARLRVQMIGDYVCHAMRDTSGEVSGACVAEPFAKNTRPSIALDNGVAVLNVTGVGRTSNAVDADAPIVETTVTLGGIASAAVDAVEIVMSNGETITVATEDRSGRFQNRFFVHSVVMDGDPFDSFGPISSIRTVTKATELDPLTNVVENAPPSDISSTPADDEATGLRHQS